MIRHATILKKEDASAHAFCELLLTVEDGRYYIGGTTERDGKISKRRMLVDRKVGPSAETEGFAALRTLINRRERDGWVTKVGELPYDHGFNFANAIGVRACALVL